MKTRELVEVKITGANQVVLKGLSAESESVKKAIYVGSEVPTQDVYLDVKDTLQISNQMRVWHLDSISTNKFGKKVAYFNKYGNRGNRIESFFLVDGEKYLFALTSGAARNGVVHRYTEPKTLLEKFFDQQGWSRNKIKEVENIKCTMHSGGNLTPTAQSEWYNCSFACDSVPLQISDGYFVNYGHEWDTMIMPAVYEIDYGTYAVEVEKRRNCDFCKVYKTKEADEEKIIEEIKKLLDK